MVGLKSLLYPAALLASLHGVAASVLRNGTKMVATYWDKDIDIFQLSFVTSLKGTPEVSFGYPVTGAEIKQCQDQGKTILLSFGGETYKEGGWDTPEEAQLMAQKVWDMYGPGGATHFGGNAVNGFDFDFEMAMENLVPFTKKLNELKRSHPNFLLTAAPQCQYPDQNLASVLTDHLGWFDALFVQFYNNPECGISGGYARRSTEEPLSGVSGGPSARRSHLAKREFNLGTWLEQASQATPKSPKIFVGVPGSAAGTPSANMGYVVPSLLKTALLPFMKHANMGGVSVWEVGYATSNGNFLPQLRGILGL
ncbi:class III chitinase [Penicillium waksmanii]|uniref:class III chitinase n=1 Tax=Penicillium waksmanii TaxID=69791 RepID=UPI002547FF53|nr:class III chitinase [Penicillium waksmanii]KAJ5965343.1 class III chitinase [Penicillium waksmanii]